MAIIQRLTNLMQKLKRLEKEAKQQDLKVVEVGYTAAYALYVHEAVGMKLKGKKRGKNRGKFWDPQGRAQAKFLEEPARTMQPELARVVAEVYKSTGSMEQALLLAGFRLQRESMTKVPVDTGNLKNSAFTRLT